MEPIIEIKNLEDLRILCGERKGNDNAIVDAAVEFAVNYTNSNLGLISVVDFENDLYLFSKERYFFTRNMSRYRQKVRLSLCIGGEELPRHERSISGFSAFMKKPYRSGNVKSEKCYLSIDEDVLSNLVVPIEHDDKLLGVITLESYNPDHYTEHHERFLCHVAEHIAEPLARVRRGEKEAYIERLAEKDFMRLYQQRHSTSQEFLRAVFQRVAERIKFLRATARIKEDNVLVLRDCYPGLKSFFNGAKPQNLFLEIGADGLPEKERSIVGYTGHIRKTQRIPDVEKFKYFYNLDNMKGSALCAPIISEGSLLGTVFFLHNSKNFYTKPTLSRVFEHFLE